MPHPLEPDHPGCAAETENQEEYIRRLEVRGQENASLFQLGGHLQTLSDLDAIGGELVAAARQTLGFPRAMLLLLDEDGGILHGWDRAQPEGEPGPPVRGIRYPMDGSSALPVRALRERRTIWMGDPPHGERPPGFSGGGGLAAVPLLAGEKSVGVVLVETERGGAPVEPDRLAELGELARQVAYAVHRVQAERFLRRWQAHRSGLEEVERTIRSATRLDEVLRAGIRVAVQSLNAGWGAIWLIDPKSRQLNAAASFGAPQSEAGPRLAALGTQADGVCRSRSARRGFEEDPAGGSAWPLLCAPVVAFDELYGAIGIAERSHGGQLESPGYSEEEESFTQLLAVQLAMAILDARLSEQLREALHQVKEVQGTLAETERLAALGEMSAKVAHEVRNPLSAIGGFARRMMKGLAEGDANRQYASIIVREVQRLEAILTEQLEFARARRPRLGPVDMNGLVRETIELLREEIESKGVRLLEAYESRIPTMLLDGDRLKQVFLNILKNAMGSTRDGHRIRVRTHTSEGWAQIEIANDGDRMPGEILEQLFVPFATARTQGCGLGLAVADQIVREHGGEIRVRSDTEWSVVFIVSLPMRSNQDRRRNPERRRVRDRRKAA